MGDFERSRLGDRDLATLQGNLSFLVSDLSNLFNDLFSDLSILLDDLLLMCFGDLFLSTF